MPASWLWTSAETCCLVAEQGVVTEVPPVLARVLHHAITIKSPLQLLLTITGKPGADGHGRDHQGTRGIRRIVNLVNWVWRHDNGGPRLDPLLIEMEQGRVRKPYALSRREAEPPAPGIAGASATEALYKVHGKSRCRSSV